ncbi:heat shock protein hsp90-like protein, partial [gut metagenome]
SREMLQQDGQLKLIRNSLEKKIKNELNAMKNNNREKYDEFFKNFGRQLKFGCYADYGMNAELLKELLMFYSAKEKKLVTLAEYVEKMPENQQFIYYAAGDSAERLEKLPAAELILDKGYDLLLLTEDVDEFCLQVLHQYGEKDKEKQFKNISSGDLGLETEEEKKEAEEKNEANKELFVEMQEVLNGKVTSVKLSTRLKSHPVCISSQGPVTLEMEKVLSQMPGAEGN